jgi:ATP/maltotriose-dependent transcriptional regulator MalT
MELVERDRFLSLLQSVCTAVAAGEGHCVFVSGEAGIGKTSLVKAFCRNLQKNCIVYQGSCDALFTPRPLAPLYDVLSQRHSELLKTSGGMEERTALFTGFFQELSDLEKTVVIVFEDIHWADEATLDFIKFFARRITQLHCLFLLTYRDTDIHAAHPLRNVLGQLPAGSFTRIQLPALSKHAVEKMAVEKGLNGQDVYNISGGNPFYVTEILASYSAGIPENIKDAILSVYNRQPEKIKETWELLSVIPAGIDIKYIEKWDPAQMAGIDHSLESKILILEKGRLFFKHELYSRTIETSLSPLKRVALNKKILDLFREYFEKDGEIERIIHHAKNANEYDLVVHYAPIAGKQAASLGAHPEACRLYLSAIEYYQGTDKDLLVELYEPYAYECYLTNRISEAIIYTTRAMHIWKEKNDTEKTGNALRFLSRLWWFAGNRKNASSCAAQAVETLDDQPASAAKAMAYSNMSQLYMLSKEPAKSLAWGEKAIEMARELNNNEILSHALNNVGSVQMTNSDTRQKGIELLQQSLGIALANGFPEHAARAYTNLCSNGIAGKDYAFSKDFLDQGIRYCQEHDLDSWFFYMLSWKARLLLETGQWKEAFSIADNMMKNEDHPAVIKITLLTVMATLRIRKGEAGAVEWLKEATARAFEAMELQRIVPVLAATLEYEWISGQQCIEQSSIDTTIGLIEQSDDFIEASEFAFWLYKSRQQELPLKKIYDGYEYRSEPKALKAAALWKQAGCPYQCALALSGGNEESKREAIGMVLQLGATAVYEKMKMEMRDAGIKSIPRGARKATRENAAYLTGRELDIVQLLKEGLQNKEIAARLFISAKTVDHHISSIFFKLEVNSRSKAVQEAIRIGIVK